MSPVSRRQTNSNVVFLASLSFVLLLVLMIAMHESSSAGTPDASVAAAATSTAATETPVVGPTTPITAPLTVGENIFYHGVNLQDKPIPFTDGPSWFQRIREGCVACHGVDGRGGMHVPPTGIIAPDIRYSSLTSTAGGEQTVYTDATIKRAITQGIDSDNESLDSAMPRWQLSPQELNDLIDFLKVLPAEAQPTPIPSIAAAPVTATVVVPSSVATVAVTPAITVTPASPLTVGEAIFQKGLNQQGKRISFIAGPPWFQRVGGGCALCHGIDGQGGMHVPPTGIIAPDIRYSSLTSTGGGEHTAYTDQTIKRAVTLGIDSDTEPLSPTMPRWQMSPQQLNDLIDFLKTLK